MPLAYWLFLVGGLLLATSLASGWLRHTPVTPFALYVVAGMAIGPWGLKVAQVHWLEHMALMEQATRVALLVSLFLGGLKLRLSWRDPRWRMALRLAFPAMVLTIAGGALAAHALAGLAWPWALAFAAAVAPTDPVLASLVSVDDARDHDALRVALSGEAGLNDGAAMPALSLAMLWLVPSTAPADWRHWLLVDVLWALPAGLLIGFGLAYAIGSLATRLKAMSGDTAPSDLLALALLALTWASAEALHASIFFAAFAAGLGLRHTERTVVSRHPNPAVRDELDELSSHPPAEVLVNPNLRDHVKPAEPAASIGLMVSDALSFGDTLERLIAAGLTLALGVAFATFWSPTGALLALLLFVVVRPLSVWLATAHSGVGHAHRLLLGWLGIRGIGGLNYLGYAAVRGVSTVEIHRLADLVVTVVVLSVLVHGASAQPLLAWRQAVQDRRGARA